MIIVLVIIAVIAGIVIAFLIVRNLMKQLGGEPDYAAHAVGKIAAGDLSIDLEIKPGDTSQPGVFAEDHAGQPAQHRGRDQEDRRRRCCARQFQHQDEDGRQGGLHQGTVRTAEPA